MSETNGKGKRKLFERVMMRCVREGCRRWVTVGPDDPKRCPACAVDGITSELEAVDMAAHIQNLPAAKD